MTSTDIYNKDWFSNRSENGQFISSKTGEILKFDNKAACHAIYTKNEIDKLLIDKAALKDECASIAKVVTPSYNWVVVQYQNQECYTNGHGIVISGLPVSNSPKGPSGIDIMYGFATHEAAHIRYTNFDCLKRTNIPNIHHWIHNVIEDECIEERICIERPGLSKFLGQVKSYMFGQSENKKFTDDLHEILGLYFYCVRYPLALRKCDKSILDKHRETLFSIYNILKKYGIFNIDPEDSSMTERNLQAAKEIYDMIKSDHEDEMEQAEKNDFNDDGMAISGSGKDGDGNPDELADFGLGETMIGACISELNAKGQHDLNKKISEMQLKSDNELFEECEICEEVERGTQPNSRIFYKTSRNERDRLMYNKTVAKFSSLIKEAQKLYVPTRLNKPLLTTNYYQQNGSLDPRLLVGAIQNERSVFLRRDFVRSNVKTNKFTLVISIDESGSMQGCYGKPHKMASELAIILYEAFRNNPDVDVYVYGHSDFVTCYLKPDTKRPEILANRHRGMGQNEELSYSMIIEDVRKENKEPILFLNITDSLYLSDSSCMTGMMEMYKKKSNVTFALFGVKTPNGLRLFTDEDSAHNDRMYGPNGWGWFDTDNQGDMIVQIRKIISTINKITKRSSK